MGSKVRSLGTTSAQKFLLFEAVRSVHSARHSLGLSAILAQAISAQTPHCVRVW